MKFDVEWLPSAEQDLAALWNAASDQDQLTDAANRIDRLLARAPLTVGEARGGNSRILIVTPLAVRYDVILDDARVVVWRVWRW